MKVKITIIVPKTVVDKMTKKGSTDMGPKIVIALFMALVMLLILATILNQTTSVTNEETERNLAITAAKAYCAQPCLTTCNLVKCEPCVLTKSLQYIERPGFKSVC